MTDVGKDKISSLPTPQEKSGGPPSGVGGPQDNSAISGEQEGNIGAAGQQNIEGGLANEEDVQSPTMSPSSPDVAQKLQGLSLNQPVNQRLDRYGTPIIKLDASQKRQASPNKKDQKEKKFKVSFTDKVEKDSDLARIHYVQSYKKYNAMNTFDPWDVGEEESSSHCCSIY